MYIISLIYKLIGYGIEKKNGNNPVNFIDKTWNKKTEQFNKFTFFLNF